MIFADVIIDISVKSIDRPFQYIVPEELLAEICIGAVVSIPFGKGNRQMKGFVVGLSGTAKFDIQKTKCISRIEKQDVVVESHLLSLAYWMKENYGSTMNDAIKAVMPVKREIQEKVQRTVFPKIGKNAMEELRAEMERKHYTARVRLLDSMLQTEEYWKGVDYETLIKQWNVSTAVIRDMVQKEVIAVESRQLYRNSMDMETGKAKRIVLNEEQKSVVEAIYAHMQETAGDTYLIHGVTGSGKTEVYLALIEKVLDTGKQAIVLIPEIALTFQTVNRFYARFGKKVSMIHSKLSQGEKYDQFLRAKRGEIQIMIGPRSALFTPFSNLGIIVIDEEHESGYQSDTMPKYHAREVAVQRAKMVGASVVLGSATPSLEAYYACQEGKAHLFNLHERAGKADMARVEIVDMRKELKSRNFSVFSRKLHEKMKDRLEKKEQIMLFLNRRGYAGFVSCRQCGYVITCERCSVSMKPHEVRKKVSELRCHYCGLVRPMPTLCPNCRSKYIGTFGLGTQQVEEMVRKNFPTARVLRMDADTTTKKGDYHAILKQFARKEADVLIGTQMIVKGHDFANVTLVGALAADLSLNAGDYRAAEKTFQLLTQAAGRAGRSEKAGEAVIQTYQPEHYSIQCAKTQNYKEFYRQEIAVRRMLQYPPISNILGVLVISKQLSEAEALAMELKEQTKGYQDIVVLGPNDDRIARLKDSYRKILYIRSQDYAVLRNIKNEMQDYVKQAEKTKDCRVQFDFNL